MFQLPPGVPSFVHINQNDFVGQKHKKQKEEDIAVCDCKFHDNLLESACGERCLNVLSSIECTPGYCPCGDYCKNQKFQKCQYAKTKLYKTEDRGWGLLAEEDIKAGQLVIEYCGEVISSEEAKQRSQYYEAQGLRDAYIISLNANYYIDATRKGSLGRFINHSCQPNCETRKWTVLGEVRVGIFAKQDISFGTELAYNYNFQWYGGANIRCLCGAPGCLKFLGAKSPAFLEYNHVWEEGDDRYTVEKVPLYDSADDETLSDLPEATSFSRPEYISGGNNDFSVAVISSMGSEHHLESSNPPVSPLYLASTTAAALNTVKTEAIDQNLDSQDTQHVFRQTNAMISRIRSNSACRNYKIESGPVPRKRAQHGANRKSKSFGAKQVDVKRVAQLFTSKEAQEQVMKYEEIRSEAASKLNSLYDEIRPAIEEHEKDNQDSVNTSVAEQWIAASCAKLKAEFDLHFSIVKNVVCPPPSRAHGEEKPAK